ncbi:MAG TPA: hypothetical protein VNH83_12750 [Bryobacteraceae bacterium]|nr:hypothetical protein [Bryobacteraceae bacterium]
MDNEKQIRWVGSAYDDLLAFPKEARKEAGFQLGKVQVGLEPADWNRSTMWVLVQKRFASGTRAASIA